MSDLEQDLIDYEINEKKNLKGGKLNNVIVMDKKKQTRKTNIKIINDDVEEIEDAEKKVSKKINKQKLGQFFTTNYKYILSNLNVPQNIKKIIEPFCGNGDLLNFIDKSKYTLECYNGYIEDIIKITKKRVRICNNLNFFYNIIFYKKNYIIKKKYIG